MIARKTIKNNLRQIIALTEKNLKLNLRFKLPLIIGMFTPIITIAMPLIIMNSFFPSVNLILYQLIAYKIYLIRGIVSEFPTQLRFEKYWRTLPALIIGPFNRFNLLLGISFSRFIVISIPFIALFVITFITTPINLITILILVVIYFLIALIFSGIGLLFGVLAISKESLGKPFLFVFNIIFWLSCLTYPYEIFPDFIQNIIDLNPLYYIFDILRLTWLDDNILLTIVAHPTHFYLLLIASVVTPVIGVYSFNFIYKKYGIVGY